MRSVTSHDVARAAGVSQPTVSRALRGDPRVARETRERVEQAAAELGYIASRRGRSLSTSATEQVGVVVRDLGNPFYMEAVGQLYARLDAAGYRMVVLTDPPDGPPVSLERLVDGGIDGVILTTTWLHSSLPAELAARGLPTVLFNRVVDEHVVDAVESDSEQGARLVAEELLALGHVKVGAIFGPLETSTGRDRERALRDALSERGAPLTEGRVRRGRFSHEVGHAAFSSLMALADPPTAVFCANDVLAIGALNAAAGLDVNVPVDVTVFGFDDIEMGAWDVYRLSTVRQDLVAMADAAVRMLDERIADRSLPPRREKVATALVKRGSHGPVSD